MKSTLLLVCAGTAGCIAYDADCPPDDTSIVGWTETLLDLRRSFVRTREAPIGNMITDAIYAHLRSEAGDLDLIAVVNAGSIRDQTDCRRAEFIDRGPIRLGQLADMLPFDNRVAMVEISESELWNALEHSVAWLGNPGEAGIAGQFLQVSHLKFTIDCSEPPASPLCVPCRRITKLSILDKDLMERELDPAALSVTPDILVGLNTFLSNGGDGFDMLSSTVPITDERPDFVAVANYIANQPDQTITPTLDDRIRLDASCTDQL